MTVQGSDLKGMEKNHSIDGVDEARAEEPPDISSEGVYIGKRKRKRMAKREEFKARKLAAKKLKTETAELKNCEIVPASVDGRTLAERKKRKQEQVRAFENLCLSNMSVVIDCDWELEHSDKALNSLAQQIMFCYSLNRKSVNPCWLYLTGVGERLHCQLTKVSSSSWIGTSVENADYLSLGIKKELVYLTSDAEDTLSDLDPGCAYVIGGIVDRNRLKGATFAKASRQGVKTAKLPIKEFCDMKSSPVLTVNHVFNILLSYCEFRSWSRAFKCILPQRKEVSILPSSVESVTDEEKHESVTLFSST